MAEQESIVEKVMMFGLTRQEGILYLCLLQNGELSGYEAAKLTGISRSNVYNALAGLAEKGAAYLLEGATSKYLGVPIEEFCENKIRYMQQTAQELRESLPGYVASSEGYITIAGYKNILDKIRNMILQADKRLYVSAPEEFLKVIGNELSKVCEKGIKVVILTNGKLQNLKKAKVYFAKKSEKQIRLITDSKYVLTGEITGSSQDTCLYSGQTNFADVFKEALRNEIKLIELTGGKGKNE